MSWICTVITGKLLLWLLSLTFERDLLVSISTNNEATQQRRVVGTFAHDGNGKGKVYRVGVVAVFVFVQFNVVCTPVNKNKSWGHFWFG